MSMVSRHLESVMKFRIKFAIKNKLIYIENIKVLKKKKKPLLLQWLYLLALSDTKFPSSRLFHYKAVL